MPRRREIPKRDIAPDPLYDSALVSKFINCVMTGGKRSTAERILYQSFDIIKEKTGDEVVEMLASWCAKYPIITIEDGCSDAMRIGPRRKMREPNARGESQFRSKLPLIRGIELKGVEVHVDTWIGGALTVAAGAASQKVGSSIFKTRSWRDHDGPGR